MVWGEHKIREENSCGHTTADSRHDENPQYTSEKAANSPERRIRLIDGLLMQV
jgi:hypothetical protein